VDVAGNGARDIAMADAIGEDYPSHVVTAGEYRGKIAAGIGAGWYRDYVGFEAGKFERTMGSFVSSPQFHASEGTDDGGCALDCFGVDFP